MVEVALELGPGLGTLRTSHRAARNTSLRAGSSAMANPLQDLDGLAALQIRSGMGTTDISALV